MHAKKFILAEKTILTILFNSLSHVMRNAFLPDSRKYRSLDLDCIYPPRSRQLSSTSDTASCLPR